MYTCRIILTQEDERVFRGMCLFAFYKRTLVCVFVFNAFSCFDSFVFFSSWYNFLVSIPLEIKIKYYELVGMARLERELTWCFVQL